MHPRQAPDLLAQRRADPARLVGHAVGFPFDKFGVSCDPDPGPVPDLDGLVPRRSEGLTLVLVDSRPAWDRVHLHGNILPDSNRQVNRPGNRGAVNLRHLH